MVNLQLLVAPGSSTSTSMANEVESDTTTKENSAQTAKSIILNASSPHIAGDGCERCASNNAQSLHGSRVKSTVNYAALNNGFRTVQRNMNRRDKNGLTGELEQIKSEGAGTRFSESATQVSAAFRKVRLDHTYCKQMNEGAFVTEQLKEKRKRLKRIREQKRQTDDAYLNFTEGASDDSNPPFVTNMSGSPTLDRHQTRRLKSPASADDLIGFAAQCRAAKPRRSAESARASPYPFESPTRASDARLSPVSGASTSPQTPPKPQRTRCGFTGNAPVGRNGQIQSHFSNQAASSDAYPTLNPNDDDEEDYDLRLLRQLEERERAQRERESALRAVSRTVSLHDDFVVDLGGVRIRPSRRRASKLPPNAIDLITAESQASSSKRISYATGLSMLHQNAGTDVGANVKSEDIKLGKDEATVRFDSGSRATRMLIDPAYTDALERCRSRTEEERQALLTHTQERMDTAIETMLIGTGRLADGDLTISSNVPRLPVTCASTESLTTVSSTESPSKLVDNLAKWLTAMRQDEADVLLEKLLDSTSAAPTGCESTPPRSSVAPITAPVVCASLSSALSPPASLEHGDSLISGVDIDELVVVTVSKNDEDALDEPNCNWASQCLPDALDTKPGAFDLHAQRSSVPSAVPTHSQLPLVVPNAVVNAPESGTTRTPQLTMVSMFWNDLPALMIDGVEHVRLVDIHKQMLPAKPTGLLKARATQLSIGVVPCTDLERDFLIRYAHAAPAKSNWCVSVSNAKRLISYYVNPLNHRQNAHAHTQDAPPPTAPTNVQAPVQPPSSNSNRKAKSTNRRVPPQSGPSSQPPPANRRRVESSKRSRTGGQSRVAVANLPKQSNAWSNPKRKPARARPVSNPSVVSQVIEPNELEFEHAAGDAVYYVDSQQFNTEVTYAPTATGWPTMRSHTSFEPLTDLSSPATFRVPARMVVRTSAARR